MIYKGNVPSNTTLQCRTTMSYMFRFIRPIIRHLHNRSLKNIIPYATCNFFVSAISLIYKHLLKIIYIHNTYIQIYLFNLKQLKVFYIEINSVKNWSLSVWHRLSVSCPQKNSASNAQIFIKFDVWVFSEHMPKKIQVSLKSDKNN
jgi:hypothetical protein